MDTSTSSRWLPASARASPSSSAAFESGTWAFSSPSALPPSPSCRAWKYSRTSVSGPYWYLFTRAMVTAAAATDSTIRKNHAPTALMMRSLRSMDLHVSG